ncbi:MAG: hypothetical protein AAFQ36_10240 [Pseudomonadota bacterium]
MLKHTLPAVIALCATAVAASSSDLVHPDLRSDDRHYTSEEWNDLAAGKTLYYFIDGQFFGREYYGFTGQFVRFQHVSGICFDGQWWHDAEAQAFCFAWPEETSCFHHVARGDEIVVLSADQAEDGHWGVQTVEQITPGGFSCDSALTS